MRKVSGHRCTNLGNSAGGVGSCIPTNSQKQEQITNNYTNMHIKKKTDSNILCGLDGCVFGSNKHRTVAFDWGTVGMRDSTLLPRCRHVKIKSIRKIITHR